jgi:hypothetical protein
MEKTFSGTWRIDSGRSTVWDDATQAYVPDEVGEEIITLRVESDVQDYEVLYGDRPTIRMGYTSRYDDPAWVPYLVREIIGAGSGDVSRSVADLKRRLRADQGERERRFEIGKAYGLVRTVYVDERTHYRVSKSAEDGTAQSVMLRRLAADGNSYLASVLDTNGIVFRTRWFVRSSSAPSSTQTKTGNNVAEHPQL